MKKLVTPFRVGVLVLFSGALLFVLLNFVKKGGMSRSESVRVFAVFKDASGLGVRGRVQIAGIEVGTIEEIELLGNKAKIWMRIRRNVDARKDSAVKKRSESLLGDYVLDLIPGSEKAPLLEDGDEITIVVDAQGMDAIFEQVSSIASDIQEVTKTLRHSLGGEKGQQALDQLIDNLVSASGELDATIKDNHAQLNKIVDNVERISADVRGITGSQSRSVETIIQNIEKTSEDVRLVAQAIREAVAGDAAKAEGTKEQMSSIKDTLAKLDRNLANLEEVTEKLKNGEGTAGKLLSDERMGQKVADTVEDLAEFANRLTGMKTEVGIRTEYGFAQGAGKNIFTLKVIPKPDKFYLLEAVDDPRGEVAQVLVQNNPPSTGQPATQVQRVTKDAIKFTAQFAKRYYFATVRLGLMESTGGIGADLNLLDDQLQIKLDAFNFSVEALAAPRLRATVRLNLFDHLVATVGMDDMLNRQVRDSFSNRLILGRDFFIGAGVYFTDDDLKALIPVVGIPSL